MPPLRVEVVDLEGTVLSSVSVHYHQAERMKGQLIARMDEQGRRDDTTVRIVDSKGRPW